MVVHVRPLLRRPEEAVSVTGWETVRGDLQQSNEDVSSRSNPL